jgi:biopolymer transport protein ExbB/TolQ
MGKTVACEAALRACRRTAALVHLEMKGGVDSLATIASVAPLIGIFGTLVGIFTSFRGVGGEKTAMLARTAGYIAIGITPAALGLLIGLIALWSYLHLRACLATFDREMQAATDLIC